MNAEAVLALAGITHRMLDHWVTRGWVKAVEQHPGSGNAREFTDAEARVAQTMARLKQAGLTVDAAHRIARGGVQLAPGVFVIVRDDRGAVPADINQELALAGQSSSPEQQ